MVDCFDSLRKTGNLYFFRKRLADQEQPCIYMREGIDGDDRLLVDPSDRGTGAFTAVKPLRVSKDGSLLLYEVKQGGERTSKFEILEVGTRRILPDSLPHGYLRGFAFAPDSKSFCYIHEPTGPGGPSPRTAYHHVIGTDKIGDRTIFHAEHDPNGRLSLISDGEWIGFIVRRFLDNTHTDFYLQSLFSRGMPACLLRDATFSFAPWLAGSRVLAMTDFCAPNRRIIELRVEESGEWEFKELVPEVEAPITAWAVAGKRLYVAYSRATATRIEIFDLKRDTAPKIGEVRSRPYETVRFLSGCCDENEFFFEAQSFTDPIAIYRCTARKTRRTLWARNGQSLRAASYAQHQVWYKSKDGTSVPMFLFGRKDVLNGGMQPTIMTSYGGYGTSMTPHFSVLVTYLVQQGCLFALPNIRGGSEFGVNWHIAAQRQNRQLAFDDFISAAEWLIHSGHTTSAQLAIFGGSNSGLLVGAALTQRPELFRAVLCLVPLLDMLRYHLFDDAHIWKNEFGTADLPKDFQALFAYSPYHRVRDGVIYPPTMIVSGDSDQKCNGCHARKMTARLQAANLDGGPIILDYGIFRGHSPVMPLSTRIEALVDRLAFLCCQLQVK